MAQQETELDPRLRRQRLLARSFLFRGLESALLDRLATLTTIRRLDPGETLFWQDDEADCLYGVVSGLVRIWLHGPDGKELTLALMEPGDFFGEIALLDGLSRSASASAIADCEVLALPRAEFLAFLEREPRLARHIIELLCERLRGNTDRIRDAAFLDLATRLAKTLVALATGHGRQVEGGTLIDVRLSQGELAQLLGVTREAVNKQLKSWGRDGLLSTQTGRLVVRDIAALAERGVG